MSHRKLQLLEQACQVLRVSGALKLAPREALDLAKARSLIESLDLKNTTDQETLGIAGNISRRLDGSANGS